MKELPLEDLEARRMSAGAHDEIAALGDTISPEGLSFFGPGVCANYRRGWVAPGETAHS
jgi:hypothetical protein